MNSLNKHIQSIITSLPAMGVLACDSFTPRGWNYEQEVDKLR